MNKLRAYCELVRLPNAFTALADILAGYCLAAGKLEWSVRLVSALLASVCLYSAGMILNDVHDAAVDLAERPTRPIPSGRILKGRAMKLGLCLLPLGVLMALGPAELSPISYWRSLAVAFALAGAILSYDFLLKDTLLGPLNMGLCRALNFLLGVVALGIIPPEQSRHIFLLVIGILLYIASLTYFGRHEAQESPRRRLMAGGIGIVLALWTVGSVSIVRSSYNDFTLVLWLALTILIARVTLRAIRTPAPTTVQYAMKTFLMGIIALDAVIASSAGGWTAGAWVLALLVPALLLGRWVYST